MMRAGQFTSVYTGVRWSEVDIIYVYVGLDMLASDFIVLTRFFFIINLEVISQSIVSIKFG